VRIPAFSPSLSWFKRNGALRFSFGLAGLELVDSLGGVGSFRGEKLGALADFTLVGR
jgi:hypothetical protein